MFSNLGFNQTSSAIQEVLNRPEFTLEDLLDEEGLVTEIKMSQQKLLDFLVKEENFPKLIRYAVLEPDLDSFEFDQKKLYKYPYVCAEILASESQNIISELFKNKSDMAMKNTVKLTQGETAEDLDEVNTGEASPEKNRDPNSSPEKSKDNGRIHLNLLFSILDSSPLNYTSAGYFTKIVNNLYSKRPYFLLSYLYEEAPEILEKLVAHISSKSVTEFLVKVLTFESSVVAGMPTESLDINKEKCLKLVVERLRPENDMEEINNAAFLICEVFGKYSTMHNSQMTLQKLLEKDTINYFFDLLKTRNSTTVCAVGLILGNILAYYILISAPELVSIFENPASEGSENQNENSLELPKRLPLIAALIDNMDDIVSYIGTHENSSVKNQFGTEIAPFGASRLKLIELMLISLKTNNPVICEKLTTSALLPTLLGLVTKYEWNNLLHNQVEKMIVAVLDLGNESLKRAVLK